MTPRRSTGPLPPPVGRPRRARLGSFRVLHAGGDRRLRLTPIRRWRKSPRHERRDALTAVRIDTGGERPPVIVQLAERSTTGPGSAAKRAASANRGGHSCERTLVDLPGPSSCQQHKGDLNVQTYEDLHRLRVGLIVKGEGAAARS